MSADMTAQDFAVFRGAALRRALESRAFRAIPIAVRTRSSYVKAAHKALTRKGYEATPAAYDPGGNCLECGEAGRCPGWHITPLSLPNG